MEYKEAREATVTTLVVTLLGLLDREFDEFSSLKTAERRIRDIADFDWRNHVVQQLASVVYSAGADSLDLSHDYTWKISTICTELLTRVAEDSSTISEIAAALRPPVTPIEEILTLVHGHAA